MAFTIPNTADAAFSDQAEPDKVDIDILVAALARTGVVSGCAVTAQGTPDMTLAVASGRVSVAGAEVDVTAGNVTITTAHATHPRFDLVVVNNSGTKSVTAGTAAADSVFPAIPANSVVLAAVYVPANDSAIGSTQIVDKRCVLDLRGRSHIGAHAYRTATQSIANSSQVALSFDAELFDTSGFHDNATNPTRFTIPAGLPGKYRLTGSVAFANNATGYRWCAWRKNANTSTGDLNYVSGVPPNGVDHHLTNTVDVDLVAGDYVELIVFQTSGGALNASLGVAATHASVAYLGP